LLAEAVSCRDRGEFREAAARLREVVRLDPQSTEAFVEMGDVLYRLGDLDRALNAYELGLRRQPMLRAALRGAAAVHGQKRDYAGAAKLLRTVLRHNPQDAEVWMNLGDIAVYQGDEVLARDAYTHALQVDPGASKVMADADKRLELLDGSSRTFRPAKP
jgi:cytochrome c-type biogenesis protein CcmH/NrfG